MKKFTSLLLILFIAAASFAATKPKDSILWDRKIWFKFYTVVNGANSYIQDPLNQNNKRWQKAWLSDAPALRKNADTMMAMKYGRCVKLGKIHNGDTTYFKRAHLIYNQ